MGDAVMWMAVVVAVVSCGVAIAALLAWRRTSEAQIAVLDDAQRLEHLLKETEQRLEQALEGRRRAESEAARARTSRQEIDRSLTQALAESTRLQDANKALEQRVDALGAAKDDARLQGLHLTSVTEERQSLVAQVMQLEEALDTMRASRDEAAASRDWARHQLSRFGIHGPEVPRPAASTVLTDLVTAHAVDGAWIVGADGLARHRAGAEALSVPSSLAVVAARAEQTLAAWLGGPVIRWSGMQGDWLAALVPLVEGRWLGAAGREQVPDAAVQLAAMRLGVPEAEADDGTMPPWPERVSLPETVVSALASLEGEGCLLTREMAREEGLAPLFLHLDRAVRDGADPLLTATCLSGRTAIAVPLDDGILCVRTLRPPTERELDALVGTLRFADLAA